MDAGAWPFRTGVAAIQSPPGVVLNDIERLRALTERDRELNSWAIRSFREVGDADY